jgi:hypothetical protein
MDVGVMDVVVWFGIMLSGWGGTMAAFGLIVVAVKGQHGGGGGAEMTVLGLGLNVVGLAILGAVWLAGLA